MKCLYSTRSQATYAITNELQNFDGAACGKEKNQKVTLFYARHIFFDDISLNPFQSKLLVLFTRFHLLHYEHKTQLDRVFKDY